MLLLYLKGGECVDVEDGIRAEIRDGTLVCFDDKNRVTAWFPAATVETYTANPAYAAVIKEEDCDDAETPPAADAVSKS